VPVVYKRTHTHTHTHLEREVELRAQLGAHLVDEVVEVDLHLLVIGMRVLVSDWNARCSC
jgi:hypothetical protein